MKGDVLIMNLKTLKILSTAATVIGVLGSLGSSYVSDKENKATIEKLVNEGLKNKNKKRS